MSDELNNEEFLKEVAAQLRKPNGEFGTEVAHKMNESNAAMNLATIKALVIKDNETILEVGMANGHFVSNVIYSANNVSYIGVDYSEDMVELARQNHGAENYSNYEFLVGDIEQLPIESNSIDKIFTVNTVYFWVNIEKAFSECTRVLRNGGLFAIAIRPEGCMRQYPSTKYDFNYFSDDDLKSIFTENGFTLEAVIKQSEPETVILEKTVVPEFLIVVGKKN